MKFRWVIAVLALVVSSFSLQPTAHAGPIELFTDVSVQPNMSEDYALKYIYGGGGLFLTANGGTDYKLLCYAGIDPSVVNSSSVYVVGAKSIFLGTPQALFQGGLDGCGWKPVAALAKRWIGDIKLDPVDPTITYVATSNGAPSLNGIYVNDGKSDAWTMLGTQSALFLNTLHVVKTTAGKRFYTTAVKSVDVKDSSGTITGSETHYLIRFSDDNGMTWTENELSKIDMFGTTDSYAELRIVAIDPTNPDHVVAVVDRSDDRAENMTVDDLIYSPMQGKANTWSLIGHATTISAVAFKPDGTLYYGDNDQSTPALYVVDKLGDKPKQLNNMWKVGCLQWDDTKKELYGCHDWQFGKVDETTGAFTLGLDMRSAKEFVECPGETPMETQCSEQLLAAYCGLGHYPQAPLCSVYDRSWYNPADFTGEPSACGCNMTGGTGGGDSSAAGAAGSVSTAGEGGMSVDTAGSGGSAGSKSTTAGASGGAAGSGAAPASKKSSSCSMRAGSEGTPTSALALGVVALLGLRRYRRRTRSAHA